MGANTFLLKSKGFSEEFTTRIAFDSVTDIPFMFRREDLIEFAEKYNKQTIKIMENSECCGAERWNDTDICSDCREHADFTE
jgi:hypothetical protein